MRIKNTLRKMNSLLYAIKASNLPPVSTALKVLRYYFVRKVPLAVMAYTPFLRFPDFPISGEETYMKKEEYIHRVINLNDLSLRPLVREKIHLFTRLNTWMGRDALNLASANDDQINDFLKQNDIVVGKNNKAGGSGFKIYSADQGDCAETIRADQPEILETYIRQHPEYQHMYPDSVNTLRIHTVRNSHEVRVFFQPKLRIGADGSVIDISPGLSYRVLLDERGRIIRAFLHKDGKKGFDKPVKRHHNTGYEFHPGKPLPYVSEAIALCKKAALWIPEIRLIGWDVAITDRGPVIVEANDVSAFWTTYQRCKETLTHIGSRLEGEEMFSFATEGVDYREETVFVSKPLVTASPELPTLRQMYLILLQTAIHRHGVEFREREYEAFETIPPQHPVEISCESETNAIRISMDGRAECVPLPFQKSELYRGFDPETTINQLPVELLFELDQKAMHHAALVYQKLIPGCAE